MKIPSKLIYSVLISLITVCSVLPIASYAREERIEAAKDDFKYSHPCPSNGNNHGPCLGYVIDHITPLACGGDDDPSNMQWQSVSEGKTKDSWELKGCDDYPKKEEYVYEDRLDAPRKE